MNAVFRSDFPDPAVLAVGDIFHAYGTQGADKNIQTLTPPDLMHWTAGVDALPEVGSWAAAGSTWAPEVISLRARYVMYYVGHDDRSGVQCIGGALSSDPAGPFRDRSARPLVCQALLGGSIDPNPEPAWRTMKVPSVPVVGRELSFAGRGRRCAVDVGPAHEDAAEKPPLCGVRRRTVGRPTVERVQADTPPAHCSGSILATSSNTSSRSATHGRNARSHRSARLDDTADRIAEAY